MKRLVITPAGWPCRLSECKPGMFVYGDTLCVLDDYGGAPVIAGGGSIFWGGCTKHDDRDALVVQPVIPLWQEFEE